MGARECAGNRKRPAALGDQRSSGWRDSRQLISTNTAALELPCKIGPELFGLTARKSSDLSISRIPLTNTNNLEENWSSTTD